MVQQTFSKLIARKITHSAEESRQFGHELALGLQPGSVLTFTGDLGSGKTTVIQGICQGLSVQEVVSSPTFTLINEYRGRLPIYHFDFYRMRTLADLHDLGVDEYFFGDGICLIEWPELVEPWLPECHQRFILAHGITIPDKIKELERSLTGTDSQENEMSANIRLIEVYTSDRIGD